MNKPSVTQTWDSPPVGIPLYLKKNRKNTWKPKKRRKSKMPHHNDEKCQHVESPSEWELPIPMEHRLPSSPSEWELPTPTEWQNKQETDWGVNVLSWDSPVTKISIGWDV